MRISTVSSLFFCTIFTALLLNGCAGHDEHAMHRQMMQNQAESTGTVKHYATPDITLINQDRMPIRLQEIMGDDRPVVMQFVYASCTTICPVLSASFSSLQQKLGAESANIQLVSITIDPEHDNPEIMKKYLKNFRAQDGWDFLTGSRQEIDEVLHAFEAYVSNKMSHKPLTFIKIPGKADWLRLDGLMSTEELYTEFRQIHP